MAMQFRDSLFQAQFLRTLGHTAAGGADISECFRAAEAISEPDPESWYRAWVALAERVEAQAEASAAAGHRVSAASLFFKASNYFRTAYIFMMQPNPDIRLIEAFRRQRSTFRKAVALQPGGAEAIAIPFEDTPLPGYFFKAPGSGPKPVLIITGGYDSTAEEAFFYSGPAALARGYHVLTYDGPGQGALLIEHGVVSRPDWEAVLAPVITWLGGRADVDPSRIVQMGISFGGYLAPRAASCVKGLAALVADPGQLSLIEEIRARVPRFVARELPDGKAWVMRLVEFMLARNIRHPTKGWAIRRGLYVHGVDTPLDYLKLSQRYTSEGRVQDIACPTLIMSAEGDEIGATAQRLYDALTVEKRMLRFTAAEGAGGHCECGGRVLVNQRVFDWLDTVLAQTNAESTVPARTLRAAG